MASSSSSSSSEKDLEAESKATTEGRVRVLSYNVYMRPPLVSESCGDFKDARLGDICSRVIPCADVILMQEMFCALTRRRRRLLAACSEQGMCHALHGPGAAPMIGYLADSGLVTLSRYPLRLVRATRFSNAGVASDKLAAKGFVLGELDVPLLKPQRLYVLNTHLQASYYDAAKAQQLSLTPEKCVYATVRRDQLAQISAALPTDAPTLVGGDLNIEYNTPEYQQMINILERGGNARADEKPKFKVTDLLQSANYANEDEKKEDQANSKEQACQVSTHESWQQLVGPEKDGQTQHHCGRLDYLLLVEPVQDGGTSPTHFSTERPAVHKFCVQGKPYKQLSDHCAVSIDLALVHASDPALAKPGSEQVTKSSDHNTPEASLTTGPTACDEKPGLESV